jgi:uncharacterized protein YabE (DUF348 family)
VTASGDYRNRMLSGVRPDPAATMDWFGGGYPPGHQSSYQQVPRFPQAPQFQQQPLGYGHQALAVRERAVEMSAVTSSFQVTTQDVLDVLGPDADDLLSTANLDVDGLISMINAETTLLPPITEELEAMFAAESAAEPDYFRQSEPDEQPGESIGRRWKKRFLKATIMAILFSATGGAAMAVAMDKDVTVDVDGHDAHIRTYDQTVGAVLKDAGYVVGPHDSMSPSPNAPVTDGGKIMLQRGRLVRLTVDGVQQDQWTRATTVGDALRELNVNTAGAWMSTGADSQIPLGGMAMQVRTPKPVTILDGAAGPRQVTTTDATIGDLLHEQNISLGPNDAVSPSLSLPIKAGMQISISRNGTSIITVTQTITPPVQTIQDPTMNEGTQTVTNPGTPGEETVTYRVTKHNGVETDRVQLSVQITTQAVAKVVRVGTKQLPGDAVWDRIAQCESGGNWSIDTGNGYYGGLQFNEATWLSNGGGQYAQYPNQASKSQQIAIADRVRAARGYEPWQCAYEIGLI